VVTDQAITLNRVINWDQVKMAEDKVRDEQSKLMASINHLFNFIRLFACFFYTF